MNSDSDSNDDIQLENVSYENQVKFYQVQHLKDDKFTLKFMGLFEKEPTVSLGNFSNESKSYYLESNFIGENDLDKKMFPQISLYINIDGRLIKLQMGIELTSNMSDEFTGLTYIELIDDEKNHREIIKRGLIYPGSTKIVYFLVRELTGEKIISYFNNE